MSNRFISGTDGRVRNTANLAIAGIGNWKFGKKSAIFRIPHFESPVGSVDGQVYPNKLVGLADSMGSFDGFFDTDPTNVTDGSTTGIYNGASVLLDLIISKTYTWGFYNIPVILADFEITEAVDNQPVKFTCSFETNGVPPMSSGTPA